MNSVQVEKISNGFVVTTYRPDRDPTKKFFVHLAAVLEVLTTALAS